MINSLQSLGTVYPNYPIHREEVVELLNIFNEIYQSQEAHNPREGYLVQFTSKKEGIKASIFPMGEARSGKLNEKENKIGSSCPFCAEQLPHNSRRLKMETATTDAVSSLSGQVLVVPKTHYSQWFEAPVEVQADLLIEAIRIRQLHPASLERPIELHCGSAAGQTVFHIHVRTNSHFA